MKHKLFVFAIAALLLGTIAPASAGLTFGGGFGAYNAAPMADPAAAAYCKSTGGVVELRKPVFGTNNPPSAQLQLAGQAYFCRYTQKSDGSRIHLLLSTLYTQMPTLAALAYYAEVPLKNANCTGGGNPASCYCTYLGGTDLFGGANLAGGAWVGPPGASDIDVDLDTCMFPDMSSIDAWGLTYHSAKIIRGIDLSKVLRYHKPAHR